MPYSRILHPAKNEIVVSSPTNYFLMLLPHRSQLALPRVRRPARGLAGPRQDRARVRHRGRGSPVPREPARAGHGLPDESVAPSIIYFPRLSNRKDCTFISLLPKKEFFR